MTDTSPLHQLQRDVQADAPDVLASIDGPPRDAGGVWWLDLAVGTKHINIEWSPLRGFGIHATETGGYGGGPDEVIDDYADTLKTVRSYITSARDEPVNLVRYDRMLRFLRNAGTAGDLEKAMALYLFDASYDPADIQRAYRRVRHEKGWR